MGQCHSNGKNMDIKAGGVVGGDDRCPTVFELERSIEEKRQASRRIHLNLVNVEFRRSLFEMYRKGDEIETRLDSTNTRMFVATHKGDNRAYAVREVTLPESRSAREVHELWRGLDTQCMLDHPNICRLQEVFCSEERYYVVTDLCSGGDPLTRLRAQERQFYEEQEAAVIIRRVAEALYHCHQQSVIHGDLRMEDCLFENPGPWADVRVVMTGARRASGTAVSEVDVGVLGATGSWAAKITCFGSDGSSSGAGAGAGVRSHVRRRTGSGGFKVKETWYLAPEVRKGEVLTEAGDMWCLGVVVYLTLAGLLPQPGMTHEAARASLTIGKPSFKGAGWASRTSAAADFVARLLQKDPRQRLTAKQALEHPWLKAVGEEDSVTLSPIVHASLRSFRDSCLIRRLGLRLVGRTVEATKMLAVKAAFRALDPSGRGYITEGALSKALHARALQSDGRNNRTYPSLIATSTPASEDTAAQAAAQEARELMYVLDAEDLGFVGFSAFTAACLAGRPADEAGSRIAFGWLDRRRKDAITTQDVKSFTGAVLTPRQLEEAFANGHDELDRLSEKFNAGPVGAAVREMECRKSAASGAAGGFTYPEFYRLLAAVPAPSVFGAPTAAAVAPGVAAAGLDGVVEGKVAAAAAVEVAMAEFEADASGKLHLSGGCEGLSFHR